MPTKNVTTAAFTDCYKVLDMALANKGVRIGFPDRNKATRFRHRCYKARSLLYKASERAVQPGTLPSTPYDDIVIRFESDVKPGGSTQVLLLLLRSQEDLPEITDLDGKPIKPIEPDFTEIKLEGI
ncbi:MAG TPA: hypothetical protein VK181_11845, partial [Rhizobium sp.]|nr:hypothetical protein [Rhizobium sp.]